jgi:hypothetical protein
VRCVGGAGASRVWCHRWVVVVGPGAAPRHGGALVSVPRHHQCLPPFTHPTQPASRCLQRWAWVVVGVFCSGGFVRGSVTWRVYGGCWVLWCLFLVVVSARRYSFTLPNLQAGACSSGHGWWSAFSVHGGFVRISVTWRVYGGCWVLTGQVSPFWGLPASLCVVLACVDSLTSHLNGEEGDWVAMCVCCAFFVVAHRHQ